MNTTQLTKKPLFRLLAAGIVSMAFAAALMAQETSKTEVSHGPGSTQFQVERGEVTMMERDEYLATLIDFLELLPPEMVVERISGDAPPDYFIGPTWCLDKPGVLLALHQEMERRDTWQGKRVRCVIG
jgi:hypothetical protein